MCHRGLTWRSAIRRCVKKLSNKAGRLSFFFMSRPPSLFQPLGGKPHQLRMNGKIPVSIGRMSVA